MITISIIETQKIRKGVTFPWHFNIQFGRHFQSEENQASNTELQKRKWKQINEQGVNKYQPLTVHLVIKAKKSYTGIQPNKISILRPE